MFEIKTKINIGFYVSACQCTVFELYEAEKNRAGRAD